MVSLGTSVLSISISVVSPAPQFICIQTREPQLKPSTYLMWHLRRQISFDAWPLALAIFVICCFERSRIMSPEDGIWFSLFRIIFECTSAYASIGISMGTPNVNYSFCGEFGVGSKVVVCISLAMGCISSASWRCEVGGAGKSRGVPG